MKVVMYISSFNPGNIDNQMSCVYHGFKKHGIDVIVKKPMNLEKCDLAVCWGVRKKHEMLTGRRSLIIERGYVGDRFYWTSIGYDGLNGRADFMNKGMPGRRWDRLFSEYIKEPVNTSKGKYALLIGQVPGDMSLIHTSIRDWYIRTSYQLKSSGHEVLFRPHPNAKNVRVPNVPTSVNRPLEQDLEEAKFVVTYNSNTGVESVLRGYPTISCDSGSMAYAVTGHSPARVPTLPDRQKWCNDIAYTQWSPEEIARGDAWEHLKGGMNGERWKGKQVSYRSPQ